MLPPLSIAVVHINDMPNMPVPKPVLSNAFSKAIKVWFHIVARTLLSLAWLFTQRCIPHLIQILLPLCPSVATFDADNVLGVPLASSLTLTLCRLSRLRRSKSSQPNRGLQPQITT